MIIRGSQVQVSYPIPENEIFKEMTGFVKFMTDETVIVEFEDVSLYAFELKELELYVACRDEKSIGEIIVELKKQKNVEVVFVQYQIYCVNDHANKTQYMLNGDGELRRYYQSRMHLEKEVTG